MNPVRSPYRKNGVSIKIVELSEVNYFSYIKADF